MKSDTKISSFEHPNNTILAEIKQSLKSEGFYLMPEYFDVNFCDGIIEFIQNYQDSDAEINYSGSEKRIWQSETKCSAILDFKHFSDKVLSSIFSVNHASFTTLAIENKVINTNTKKDILGRWHLDSFKKQYKVFLFLSDVDENSGPFEFIPKSHGLKLKWNVFLKNKGYKDFFNLIMGKGTRFYSKLDDVFVENLIANGFPAKPVICKKGTLLFINTAAIHRARPAISGSRYALTSYYK